MYLLFGGRLILAEVSSKGLRQQYLNPVQVDAIGHVILYLGFCSYPFLQKPSVMSL